CGLGDHLPLAEVGASVDEAEVLGTSLLRACGRADRDQLEDPPELAAVGVRIHPHRAADGPRDVHPELEAGQPPARRLRSGRGEPGPTAADDALAVALYVGH